MGSPIHAELVHDRDRHRHLIGYTDDPFILRLAAERLIIEAEKRAAQLDGINDVWAEDERAEAHRLRRLIAILFPEEEEEEEVGA